MKITPIAANAIQITLENGDSFDLHDEHGGRLSIYRTTEDKRDFSVLSGLMDSVKLIEATEAITIRREGTK